MREEALLKRMAELAVQNSAYAKARKKEGTWHIDDDEWRKLVPGEMAPRLCTLG